MEMSRPEDSELHDRPEPTSAIIARLGGEDDGGKVEIGTIVDTLYDRSFGVIIILFALPNTIFPIAWVLGLPILLFTVQMAMGRQRPWLPQRMRRQGLDRETFKKIIAYVVKYLSKIEVWLKPRWNFLTTDPVERVLGVFLTLLTLILMVPVPFGNALPSFGIAVVAAGLLQKDGVAIAIGSLIGIAGTVYVLAVIGGIWAAARALLGF